MKKEQNILEVSDFTLTTISEISDRTIYNYAIYEKICKKNGVEVYLDTYDLETGILYLHEDLKAFNGGFLFKDKYNNLYNTAKNKIYFNCGFEFEGDLDKPAFSLFDGFDEFEKKIKNEIKKDKSEEEKKKLKNEIFEELKTKLEKFDMNNVILKNGKYFYSDIKYVYIHDNILEYYENNEKLYEYRGFFQEINNEYHTINIIPYGNCKYIKDNYEGEIFYNTRIGKGKLQDDNNNKFFFCRKETDINKLLKKIKDEDEYLFTVDDKRISLEKNRKNPDGYAEILIKDKNNEKVIYEILVKLSKDNKPIGNGIVKDKREGKLLLVNFDTNNIISNDVLDIIPKFVDEEEYNKYKIQKQKPKNKEYNIVPVNEIIPRKIDIKKEILKTDKLIEEINNISNKMLEKIQKIKIESLGIKDQQRSGECWLYSICQIISYANSRILGRKFDVFENLKEKISRDYTTLGKTNKQMEIIMNKYLPAYNLHYEKISNENIDELKERLKRGIKCILTFDLNNKQWYNFKKYFDDTTIKQKDKLLTLDKLNQPVNVKIEKPDETSGHALILFDIDENDNYIMVNSWGEKWGYKGTFKATRECFVDTQAIYSVHWFENELKPEEIQAWNDFHDSMINLLENMKSIRCPKCKRSAHIDQYEVIGGRNNKLRCPFSSKCEFEINYNNDNYDFILEQLLTYDLFLEKDVNKKFDLGLDRFKTIY